MDGHALPTHTADATIAAAMNQGGVDVNCGQYYAQHVCDALEHGAISSTDLDRAARRYWRTMMRLGMFDDMESQPFITEIGAKDVDSAENRALAKRAACHSSAVMVRARRLD